MSPTYTDNNAAFEYVDRTALWKALRLKRESHFSLSFFRYMLTKSHLQTRLFISMSTRHLVDLLIARGDVLLVVLGTTGSNNSKTTPTNLSQISAGNNATLLAG